MYPTHLLPPTLRRAAQLLALDAMADDISHCPYLIPLDDVLDREFGYWRTVPGAVNFERLNHVLHETASSCQSAA